MCIRLLFACLAILSLSSHVQATVEDQTTHRVLQFENEHVRVWKTVMKPNQSMKNHRYDSFRVVVGLEGGSLTKIDESGDVSELKFETGKAYWLTEDAPGRLHEVLNKTNEPIELLVVEIKS